MEFTELTLNDISQDNKVHEFLSAEDAISCLLEQAQDKYGYYKAHVKGYYELKKNASDDELYDVLRYSRNKDGSLSAFIDNSLFFKYFERRDTAFIKEKTFNVLFPDMSAERVNQPEGFVKTNVKNDDLATVFQLIIDETIKNYFPSHRFGCCSSCDDCSDAGRCLHEDLFYAKGCMYREHLEKGEIFYGKRKNIG